MTIAFARPQYVSFRLFSINHLYCQLGAIFVAASHSSDSSKLKSSTSSFLSTMALVTVTTTSTVSDFVEPSASSTFTTTSIQIHVPATPGQTITLELPSFYSIPSAPYTTTFVPVQTCTVTEFDVYLEGPLGNIWTTIVLDVSPTGLPNPLSSGGSGEKVFVVPCPGWNCWSVGAKVGLIIGVVLGAFLLFMLLCCIRKWHKRNVWISHGVHGANDYERWQDSHPGWGYYGPPQANLQTGWGLRPYPTPAQAEVALRGGASRRESTNSSS